jgi:hypothetical protein
MSQRTWPEVWAGGEGTLNRVEDCSCDPCRRNGHHEQPHGVAELLHRGLAFNLLFPHYSGDG